MLQQQETVESHYCISLSWVKLWDGFVTGREREPPGPIDNRAIIVSNSGKGPGSHTLRRGADFMQTSRDIWLLFHSIYGGGPEVIIKPNGAVIVNNNSGKPSRPALSTRVRSRSISETPSSSGTNALARTTRSKAKSESARN